ncbi:MAG TPA: ATP-dependent DNA helicase RecG [Thermoanaerobaculia bacterium]|nr:ATP-dependent DNA helicase RecG [Thermoanaerobaculia bacterium]HUM30379.1 ATP-dependent DNA helicase RecG [Thermoanaerobaculia bacterium]HXK68610.1 ATP-dependent DNA helicase RecG [Thermoanaerobaculia bacterium]
MPEPSRGLFTEVRFLRGVGPRRAEELSRRGIRTCWDLLRLLPLRLEDRSRLTPIAGLGEEGETYTIAGRVLSIQGRPARRRSMYVVTALVSDDSGTIGIVWFNQKYVLDKISPGHEVVFHGKLAFSPQFQLVNPVWEPIESGGERTGRVVPVYPSMGTLKSPQIQKWVSHAFQVCKDEIQDPLPDWLLRDLHLPTLSEALSVIHGDGEIDSYYFGRNRLAFDELLSFLLVMDQLREKIKDLGGARTFTITDETREHARRMLPFKLTAAQERVVREIVSDLTCGRRMHRLLQGDVGSGKTIIAVLISLISMGNGYQVAFMAPTSILAEQHFLTLSSLFQNSPYSIALLTGSTPGKERKKILEDLKDGTLFFLVGTHALIENPVQFRQLGLIIVDEQHRFGVEQRRALAEKADGPHYLVMTATPIPRTLALALYGDLDISTIDELPPGRRPIQTHLRNESSREKIYDFIRERCREGEQAYIVFPLIEENETIDTRSLEVHGKELVGKMAPLNVGILHGRMDGSTKAGIMRDFASHKINILLSTTVIEVGIDVREATIMVIENAERFGLAQLHQLRGRVGRGSRLSHCILIHGDHLSEKASERLEAFVQTTNGFDLAELDLSFRGMGDLTGSRQWGLPGFKIVDLRRDIGLLSRAFDGLNRLKARQTEHELRELKETLSLLWSQEEEVIA